MGTFNHKKRKKNRFNDEISKISNQKLMQVWDFFFFFFFFIENWLCIFQQHSSGNVLHDVEVIGVYKKIVHKRASNFEQIKSYSIVSNKRSVHLFIYRTIYVISFPDPNVYLPLKFIFPKKGIRYSYTYSPHVYSFSNGY